MKKWGRWATGAFSARVNEPNPVRLMHLFGCNILSNCIVLYHNNRRHGLHASDRAIQPHQLRFGTARFIPVSSMSQALEAKHVWYYSTMLKRMTLVQGEEIVVPKPRLGPIYEHSSGSRHRLSKSPKPSNLAQHSSSADEVGCRCTSLIV